MFRPYMHSMELITIAVPLLLVIDPFGNLPFVVAVFGRLSIRHYLWAVSREILIATVVLGIFALLGQRLLLWFGIEQASLYVAGGVVLFLIALKMVFGSAAELFHSDEAMAVDPVVVPIAMPSVVGPSAVATVLFFASREDIGCEDLLMAMLLVMVVTWVIFAVGRPVASWLGQRGLTALEKLTGMLLSILAVDMIFDGIQRLWG